MSTINLFKSNLSEKLSLVANSPIFIQYINSGELTRRNMYVPFLTRVSEIADPAIIGMEIFSKKGDTLFHYGDKSSYHILLNLCYLNQELNNSYGNCSFSWQLYFSKSAIIDRLKKMNSHVTLCESCHNEVNILKGQLFGTFDVLGFSNLNIGLKIKNSDSIDDFLFPIFIMMMIALAYWIFVRTHKTIKNNLSGPLNRITSSLRSGKLPKDGGYIEELKYLVNQVNLFYNNKDKIEIARIAKQAAHDLRSPLIAMETVLRNTGTPTESELHVLKSATRQIHDITNNLLQKNVTKEAINVEQLKDVLLFPIIDYVASEKNAEFSNKRNPINIKVNVDQNTYKTFIKVVPAEMKRALSNICNNSFDALRNISDSKLSINVTSTFQDYLKITVTDNGCGIPHTHISEIFKEGVSYKEKGNGLGLYHAKENIENWNGKINISSEINKGTTVEITLPKQPQADWFGDKLNILKGAKLIIVDDSDSIHIQWEERIKELNEVSIELVHFTDPEVFISWYKASADRNNKEIYLIDHEFTGKDISGLDIVEKMDKLSQRFLVTSYSEHSDLQDACKKLIIKLMPKYFVPHLPISILNGLEEILIVESNPTLIDAYKFRALKNKISVKVYQNPTELFTDIRLYPINTKIYVSEIYTNYVQLIRELSYKNIIVTAHEQKKIGHHADIEYASKVFNLIG